MSALELTNYGFRWHHVEVERSASLDVKRGKYLSLTLKTGREWLQVDVTPSGLFRTKSIRPAL